MSKRINKRMKRKKIRRALKAVPITGHISTTKLIRARYGDGANAHKLKEKYCD